MNSDEEDDIASRENIPVFRKAKEIFDLASKITAHIQENDEYLMDIKTGCYLMPRN